MPLALILSSFVAASRIGGAAQQYVLAAHHIDPVLVPTVMLGRSPAKGAHGQATPPDIFAQMLADVEADALFGLVDLVITGHFSSPEQVVIAADALARIQAAAPRAPVVVVDPILGDEPTGLYVKPEVARAVAERLVPLGDWITPNLWELGHLTGCTITNAASAVAAARRLGRPALITSAPAGEGEIGLIYADAESATLFAHPQARRRAQRHRRPGDRELRRGPCGRPDPARRRRTRRPGRQRGHQGRAGLARPGTADRGPGRAAGAPDRTLAYRAALTARPNL